MNMNNASIQLPKTLNTYLGQKGYTIYKKDLNNEQQQFLKTELTAKPFTQGSFGPGASQTHTFPIYRESDNKFYVPRYFGEEHLDFLKI